MEYMTTLLQKYDSLRGKQKSEWDVLFWDAVVITAADESQKHAFELQIAEKKLLKELPLLDAIHVIADPPGRKTGSGGATLIALREISSLYGDNLHEMKILLIHAGGQSQRIPSHSCLGKLFALLPLGHPSYQVIDLKLAMYLPFLERMKPGVFLTASDDIITYDLNQNPHWSFRENGFTVLAHTSPLDVAMGHGVYVMSSDLSECIRVLQKPSLFLLEESGAIFSDASGNDCAYTDSAYFFDHDITKKLLGIFEDLGIPSCEVDAYGDFLRPLGTQPSDDYIPCDGDLGYIRGKLYKALRGCQLNVVVLKNSTFYHLGTMNEYIDNLSLCKDLSRSLGINRKSFCYPNNNTKTMKGIIMHSYVNENSKLGERSILDCCDFLVPVVMEEGILSNCQLSCWDSLEAVNIPNGTFFYTCPIKFGDRDIYATVAFHVNDDIKKSCDILECGKLKYMNFNLEKIADPPTILFDSDEKVCSLWNACLFEPGVTRNDAFKASLRFVKNMKISDNGAKRFSLRDIFRLKDIERILRFHGELKQKISKFHSIEAAGDVS